VSAARAIRRRAHLPAAELRARVHAQLSALHARGWTPPAGAVLVVHEPTGRLMGFIPASEQRAAAMEAARDGLDVRELGPDGSERHVIESCAVGMS
jgi:hypothetical protein